LTHLCVNQRRKFQKCHLWKKLRTTKLKSRLRKIKTEFLNLKKQKLRKPQSPFLFLFQSLLLLHSLWLSYPQLPFHHFLKMINKRNKRMRKLGSKWKRRRNWWSLIWLNNCSIKRNWCKKTKERNNKLKTLRKLSYANNVGQIKNALHAEWKFKGNSSTIISLYLPTTTKLTKTVTNDYC